MSKTNTGFIQGGGMVAHRPISFAGSAARGMQATREMAVWVHPKGRVYVVEPGAGRTAVREHFLGAAR